MYEEWKYTGPVLPLSSSEKRLQGAVEYLGYVLAEQMQKGFFSDSEIDGMKKKLLE